MKITLAFYGHLLKIILLFILFSALFGVFNDQFIFLLTDSTIAELMTNSSIFKYLFFAQFGGFVAAVYVLYQNKLQFIGWLPRKNGKKLSTKVSSFILSVSCIFLILPFLYLIS